MTLWQNKYVLFNKIMVFIALLFTVNVIFLEKLCSIKIKIQYRSKSEFSSLESWQVDIYLSY